MPGLDALYTLVDTFPQRVGYDPIAAKLLGPASPHFWYREVFHLVGGAVVALGATRRGLRVWVYAFLALMTAIVLKETYEVWLWGQKPMKTALDLLAWPAGYLAVTALRRQNATATNSTSTSAPPTGRPGTA